MGPDDTPTGRELSRNTSAYITETPRGGPLGDGKKKPGFVGKKSSPERLRQFLDRLVKYPHITQACAATGLSYKSLRYYLAKSENGQPGDGFDLTYGEETKRFHLHYMDVMDLASQMIEDAVWKRAFQGYYETLSDKGRVIYQIDPVLAGLGVTGPDAYLLDENNKPIPERIEHQDPELMIEWLRAFRKDRWGRSDKLDVSVRGGVMVVGVRAKIKEVEAGEKEALTAPLDVEFREVEDD